MKTVSFSYSFIHAYNLYTLVLTFRISPYWSGHSRFYINTDICKPYVNCHRSDRHRSDQTCINILQFSNHLQPSFLDR